VLAFAGGVDYQHKYVLAVGNCYRQNSKNEMLVKMLSVLVLLYLRSEPWI
jgi:hypothetical protein